MDNRPDIWRHLQDHQTTPPPELFDRIRALYSENKDDKGSLERLQQYPQTPPEYLRTTIITLIQEDAGTIQSRPSRRIYRYLRKPLSYAAALIILLAGGWLFMWSRMDRRQRVPRLAGPPVTNASRNLPGDTANKLKMEDSNPSIDPDSATALNPGAPANAAFHEKPALNIAGLSLPLAGNDLLAAFCSYKSPSIAACFRDSEQQEMRLHVDQYADILLSAGMKHMIKEMFETHNNGLPTRTARKVKERIEKWRTIDAKQFDAFLANPLDPVDLAEFLYPPFFSFGKRTPSAATLMAPDDVPKAERAVRQGTDLTISYGISIPSKRNDDGIGETYNGGMQTVFASGGRSRLRLVTLMRIQSIYAVAGDGYITVVKESGRRIQRSLRTGEWSALNRKYKGAAFSNMDEKTSILGHSCQKGLISLKDGKKITVWYTPHWQSPVSQLLQPAFALVPGVVLQYEYTCRRKTVRYTATSISERPIDPAVFDSNSH